MIKYYKKTIGNQVISLGYIDETNPMNMLFEDYLESEYFELSEIELSEFLELGKKYKFSGLDIPNIILPSSYFPKLSLS